MLHAFCAALRACLHEQTLAVAQLEAQHRTNGLSLHQLWYYLQPAGRSLARAHPACARAMPSMFGTRVALRTV